MKTNLQNPSRRAGGILPIVMVVLVAFSLLIAALLQAGQSGSQEAAYQLRSTQAFWLAEAGRQWCIADLYAGTAGNNGVSPPAAAGTNVPGGTFKVTKDPDDSSVRFAIGSVAAGGQTVTRRIRIDLAFLPLPFEKAVYAGNYAGTPYTFSLRGIGSSTPPASGPGGRDSIGGDSHINGDISMDGESSINPPNPNRYLSAGDLDATGTITVGPDASVSGIRNPGVAAVPPPDLNAMNYADNNSYDIAQLFRDAHISSGRLPSSHPLYNVVVKNPSNRADENNSTSGDDFYFEPANIGSSGTPTTAVTPLNLGDDKVYYVDGHVWFNNHSTYGFRLNGTATIVSTLDIHVSDNLSYNDRNPAHADSDMLALVALGRYTGDTRTSGGDIYFGDPEFGTLYTVDAFMFANNNFYYNTRSNGGGQEEPTSGFKVFGNFMAVNQVVVLRDWYTPAPNQSSRAASYDSVSGQWKDALTGVPLTSKQINGYSYISGYWYGKPVYTSVPGIRHYAMQVNYDDRIRDAAIQMPGLPRGNGKIFAGATGWEEIEAN
jgi:hypothetical protein